MIPITEIESVLAKLDPKTRARVQSAQDIKIEKQLTPSIGLNFALRGGLGYGRQALVWGNKSAGKSSFCLQMIALAQKEGKTCAWIDAEASYDQSWAEKLGVDSSSLIYSPAKTINDMVDVATKLMDAGVDLIVVDSISALLPAIYFEKDGNEMKDLQDTKQIGAEAKDMTHAVKMLNYANKNTLLVLISQQRNQVVCFCLHNLDLCMLVTSPQAAWLSSSSLPQLSNSGLLKLRLTLSRLALKLATKLLSKELAGQLTGLLITTSSAPQIYQDNTTFTTKGKLLV
jgi:adenosyl cobinamide kinase/adenosyl cobinamide phosphate guanylyltransferase